MSTAWLLAHGAVARHELWAAWGRDPLVLVAIGAFALAYGNGVLAARGRPALVPVVRRRAAAAVAGLAVLVVALASPLEAAASSLFAAHMAQHLLLTAVAAPLLVLARPVATLRRGLPTRWSAPARTAHRRLAPLTAATAWPGVAVLIALTVLSAWHVPALYGAALRSPVVHVLEHATLLASALVLWSAVLGSARRRQVLRSVGALALSALHGGALGALLALSPRPWYAEHAAGALVWGIDPLADQQVAGAIMWIPTAVVHLGALALVLHRWLAGTGAATSAAPAWRAASSG